MGGPFHALKQKSLGHSQLACLGGEWPGQGCGHGGRRMLLGGRQFPPVLFALGMAAAVEVGFGESNGTEQFMQFFVLPHHEQHLKTNEDSIKMA